MLKKFFISMLGTIAGLWLTILILAIVLLSIIAGLVGSEKSGMKPHTVLCISLDGDMPERYQPANVWDIVRDADDSSEALADILDAIELAATDDDITGICINAGMGGAGSASREEIVAALNRFKQSGKWVLAYGDNYSQGDMIVASVADSVYLNPMGTVDVHGVTSTTPFLTGLLDKVGVKVQVVRVGQFKSAVEPFIAKQMSEPSRLQTQALVDELWHFTSTTIADGRGTTVETVNEWADSIISCWPAQRVLEAGAVSALAYRRAFDDMLREYSGLDNDEDLRTVTPSEYLAIRRPEAFDNTNQPHVAVLYAVGDIVDSGTEGISGEVMTPQIIDLADDEDVRALVLRINSGGGSAFASEQIWEALEYFKSKGKPFYVSMSDVAASGGYYIACGADSIWADATTLTGSIGVFGMIPDLSGLVTGHLGITFDVVTTNPKASTFNLLQPQSPAHIEALQHSVEHIYDTFTRRVADGRHLSLDSVYSIAEGRVWVGAQALRIGLVDRIGTLYDAVSAARAAVDVEDVQAYPLVESDFLMDLLRQADQEISVGGVSANPAAARLIHGLDAMMRINPVQARMEPLQIQ